MYRAASGGRPLLTGAVFAGALIGALDGVDVGCFTDKMGLTSAEALHVIVRCGAACIAAGFAVGLLAALAVAVVARARRRFANALPLAWSFFAASFIAFVVVECRRLVAGPRVPPA